MGFGLICAGLVFLFNPNINIIDISPDFIGLWLVCAGLTKLAQINADLMEARGFFFKLSIVELAKFFSILLISSQDPTRYLLLSFVFGVIECILFTLSVRSFFIGLENIGMRFSSKTVLATYKKKKGAVTADVSTRLRKYMLTFFYLRTVFAMLPEFTELQSSSVISSNRMPLSQFKGVFYGLAVIIVFVLGIIYISRVTKFFKGCQRDTAFINSLRDSYDKFLVINKNYQVSRVMKLVLILYAGAAALTYNPTDDGLIKIPLVLCGIVLIIISFILAVINKKALYAAIPAGIMSVLSVIDFIKKDAFYVDNTKFDDIFHIESAMDKYSVINNLALVEYILLFVSFMMITSIIMRSMSEHIPMALSYNSVELRPNEDELEEINGAFGKYSTIITALMAASVIIYGALTKIAIIAGEQAAFIDRDDINVPQIVFSWLSVGANAITAAWFVAVVLLLGYARKHIYGCVYNWSVVREE